RAGCAVSRGIEPPIRQICRGRPSRHGLVAPPGLLAWLAGGVTTPYFGKPVTSVPVTPYTTSVDVNFPWQIHRCAVSIGGRYRHAKSCDGETTLPPRRTPGQGCYGRAGGNWQAGKPGRQYPRPGCLGR